jgi:hypothetical protein
VSQQKDTPASAPTPAISAGVTPENPYGTPLTYYCTSRGSSNIGVLL